MLKFIVVRLVSSILLRLRIVMIGFAKLKVGEVVFNSKAYTVSEVFSIGKAKGKLNFTREYHELHCRATSLVLGTNFTAL